MNYMSHNLHTHTTYCDGRSTPEEIIQEAISRGFDVLGFSGHGFTTCDDGYCMTREGTSAYRKELLALREKYADQIRIYIGIEQDFFSDPLSYPWDYVIGSVHYILVDGVIVPVDETRGHLERAAAKHYGGDIYGLISDYYKLVSRVVTVTGCDIIGHFDLIRKFNQDGTLFDPDSADYIESWTHALDRIFAGADVGPLWEGFQRTGVSSQNSPIFEINTGAISRGYQSLPYPSIDILHGIYARGGRIMINSDSHDKRTLNDHFELARDLALEAGFTETTILTEEGFVQIPL